MLLNDAGFFGGGIRSGHPELTVQGPGGLEYQDSDNDFLRIHNNHITQNGVLGGAGGGVSMCHGFMHTCTRSRDLHSCYQ